MCDLVSWLHTSGMIASAQLRLLRACDFCLTRDPARFWTTCVCASSTAAMVLGQTSTGSNSSVTAASNDLTALNYALTLERLELAFYTAGQSAFAASDFTAAGFPSGAWDYFNVIAAHEAAHVSALVTTITSLGGTPLDACIYDFNSSLSSVGTYVDTALALESTGVTAYDGTINALTSTALQEVAATIATIEARHAAYLRVLTNTSAFPDAFDTAATPTAVINAASGFITSCPFALDGDFLPIVRPGGVATLTTLAQAAPSSSEPSADAVYTAAEFENDLVALNYALTLEHLEAEFYAAGLKKYTVGNFTAAFPDNGAALYTQFVLIGAHEAAHVLALTVTIEARRTSAAVPVCKYNFTAATATLASFIATARVLENTGVSAYDGAVNTITDTGLQQVAATIATVEARHAAFLNLVEGANATNGGNFDTAVAPSDILVDVANTGLLLSCNYTIEVPVVNPGAADTSSGAAEGGESSTAENGGAASSSSGGATTGASGSTAAAGAATGSAGSTAAGGTTTGTTTGGGGGTGVINPNNAASSRAAHDTRLLLITLLAAVIGVAMSVL